MLFEKNLKTALTVTCAVLIAVLTSADAASANPPASPYAFGFTLDPACAPGDANCTVSAPTFAAVLASSSSTGANDIVMAAGQKIDMLSGVGFTHGYLEVRDNSGSGKGLYLTAPMSAGSDPAKVMLNDNDEGNAWLVGSAGYWNGVNNDGVAFGKAGSEFLNANENDGITMEIKANVLDDLVFHDGFNGWPGGGEVGRITNGTLAGTVGMTFSAAGDKTINFVDDVVITDGKKLLGGNGAYIDLDNGGNGGIAIATNNQPISIPGVNADINMDGKISFQGGAGVIQTTSGEDLKLASLSGANLRFWDDVDLDTNGGRFNVTAPTTTISGDFLLASSLGKIWGPNRAYIDLNNNSGIKLWSPDEASIRVEEYVYLDAGGNSINALSDFRLDSGKKMIGPNGSSINLDENADGGVKITAAASKPVIIANADGGGTVFEATGAFGGRVSVYEDYVEIQELNLPTGLGTSGDVSMADGTKIVGRTGGGASLDLNYGGTGGIEIKPAPGQPIVYSGNLGVSSLQNVAQPEGTLSLGLLTRLTGEYGLIRLSGSGETGGAEGAYIYGDADGSHSFIQVEDWDPGLSGNILLSAPTTTLTGDLDLSVNGKKLKLYGGEIQGNGEAVEIRSWPNTNSGSAVVVGPDATYMWDQGSLVAWFGEDGDHGGLTVLKNLTMGTSGKRIIGATGAFIDLDADGVGNINLKPAAGKAITLDNDVNLDTTQERLTLGRFDDGSGNGDRIVVDHDINTISALAHNNINLNATTSIDINAPITRVTGDLKMMTSGKKIVGFNGASIDMDQNSGVKLLSADNSSVSVEEHIYLDAGTNAIFLNSNTELARGVNFKHTLMGDNSTSFILDADGNWNLIEAKNDYISLNAEVGHVTVDASGVTVAGPLIATGLAEYADNAAAVGAGLSIGTFYRTGDFVKVVH